MNTSGRLPSHRKSAGHRHQLPTPTNTRGDSFMSAPPSPNIANIFAERAPGVRAVFGTGFEDEEEDDDDTQPTRYKPQNLATATI